MKDDWYNQITLLPPPTQQHSFFRNFHPLLIYKQPCPDSGLSGYLSAHYLEKCFTQIYTCSQRA